MLISYPKHLSPAAVHKNHHSHLQNQSFYIVEKKKELSLDFIVKTTGRHDFSPLLTTLHQSTRNIHKQSRSSTVAEYIEPVSRTVNTDIEKLSQTSKLPVSQRRK